MAPVNLVGRRKRTITAELTFDETDDSPVLFLFGHADFGHGQVCRVDIRWDGQSSLTVPPSEDRVRFEYYLRNDDGDYVEKSGAREEYEHDSQVEGFVSKGEHAQIVVLPDWMEALVGERISVNDLGTGFLSVRFIPAYEAGYRGDDPNIHTAEALGWQLAQEAADDVFISAGGFTRREADELGRLAGEGRLDEHRAYVRWVQAGRPGDPPFTL